MTDDQIMELWARVRAQQGDIVTPLHAYAGALEAEVRALRARVEELEKKLKELEK